MRAATEQEIRERTRAVLVAHGREGLTLRAIARELGMTAPALYRYYGSREDLLRAVVNDICTELAGDLTAAAGAVPDDDGVGAVLAVCRAFRRWALAHPQEFGLVFATPEHGCQPGCGPNCQCGHAQFARAFLVVGARLIANHRLRVPADAALPPAVVSGLARFRQDVQDTLAAAGAPVPAELVGTGAVYVFLQTWARLYGHVALEAFGQLTFAVDDAEPLFEAMLADLAADLVSPGVSALPDR